MKSHKTQLVKKPFIVLITKTDTILSTSISKFSKDFPIIPISSISGDGLQKAISQISKLLKWFKSQISYILLLNLARCKYYIEIEQ